MDIMALLLCPSWRDEVDGLYLVGRSTFGLHLAGTFVTITIC